MLKLSKNYKEKIKRCYKDLVHYYIENKKEELTLNDKPFFNLMSAIDENKENFSFYDPDIIMFTIENKLKENELNPSNIGNNEIKKLLEEIETNLKINAEEHFIILPILKAKLNKTISFNEFLFIPKNYKKEEKFNILSSFSNIEKNNIKDYMNHVEISRSKDFMKHNLMMIKFKHQTNIVRLRAENIAKFSLYLLRLIYFAEINNPTSSGPRLLDPDALYSYEKNTHIAILSKDNYDMFCTPINFFTEIEFSLNFLNENKIQNLFIELSNVFIFKNNLEFGK